MSDGNGLVRHNVPEYSLLRRVVARIQLVEGAPHRALKTPTALQAVEIDDIQQISDPKAQLTATLAMLVKLMPDATPEEMADLSFGQIFGIIGAARKAVIDMEERTKTALEDLDPNGVRGTTPTGSPGSPPETPSVTSATASPSPVGAMSGGS